jgi:hypothetical protein
MLSVPVREPPLLAATENATLPLPVPVLPLVTLIQPTFDVALHPHVGPAVTVTVPGPPPAAIVCPVG